MTRHIRDLTTSENLLVVSSRFWFKAHIFKCNTPLILLRDVFKSANLSNSIRDFHSLMMAIAHMTKTKKIPTYQSPITGNAEELLIKIVKLAQRGGEKDLEKIFSECFFEGDSKHFINAATNLAEDFFCNDLVIMDKRTNDIFYQENKKQAYAIN